MWNFALLDFHIKKTADIFMNTKQLKSKLVTTDASATSS